MIFAEPLDEVVQNKFAATIQCNWAFDNYFQKGDWVLRLDSDERVQLPLLSELETLAAENNPVVGYIHREMYWMGRKLKYAALRRHFIGRFFPIGFARYEEVTEEHLVHNCPRVNIKTKFYEHNTKNLIEHFLQKHIQTAKGEVLELLEPDKVKAGSLFDKVSVYEVHYCARKDRRIIVNSNL